MRAADDGEGITALTDSHSLSNGTSLPSPSESAADASYRRLGGVDAMEKDKSPELPSRVVDLAARDSCVR
jgi:hypothetical protein